MGKTEETPMRMIGMTEMRKVITEKVGIGFLLVSLAHYALAATLLVTSVCGAGRVASGQSILSYAERSLSVL